jgi:Cof subfamily protein (haloacid dehalogenase superfamily)
MLNSVSNVSVSAPVRLLLVDVDGTLVGHDLEISPGVRQAIEAVRKRGVHVGLCTGRPEIATRHYIEELNLDGYHVFDAGALIKDTLADKVLFHRPLPNHIARQIVDYAHAHNINIEAYGAGGYFVEEMLERTQVHAGLQRFQPTLTNFVELIGKIEITKMEAVTVNEEEKARAQTMLDHFSHGGEMDYGWAIVPGLDIQFVNILAKGISKGEAVDQLIAHTGLPHAQIMGIGDGPNDEPLLKAVGIGVAMGNAPDSLKQHAEWVTASVDEDGLARAIERFILNA